MISTKQILLDRPGVFNPRQLGKLEAWFDALDTRTMLSGDGSTITDGGAVALWGDKSGNSGVNCLVLPGVAGNYASFTALTAFGTGNFSVSVKATAQDIAAHQALIGSNTSGFGFRVLNPTRVIAAEKVGISNTGIGPALVVGREYVLGYTKNGTTGTFYVDGVAAGTITDNANYSTGVGELGTYSLGTVSPLSGLIKWARVYSAALDATAMAADAAGTVQANNVLNCDFSTAGKKLANGDTFVCATGQTVTLNSSGATGARIAGERDLFQGTLANRPVYLNYAGTKYGYLNGASGNYFSTPDSVVVSVGERFALAVDSSRADWTPSATQIFLAKRTAGHYTLLFYLRTDGKIDLGVSINGNTTAVLFTSSAAVPDVAGARYFIGAEVDLNNGSGSSASFYTSSDGGATWSALGVTQTNVGTFTPFDGTAPLEVGSQQDGTVALSECRIYRAFITAGTLTDAKTADFNPALYTSGTTFTASTGEVWTINGGAHIVTRTGLYGDGVNDFLASAAYSAALPASLYAVIDQVSYTDLDTLFDGNGVVSAPGSMSVRQRTSSGTLETVIGGDVGGSNVTLAMKTAAVVALKAVSGNAASIRFNRGAATSENSGASTNPNGLMVFARNNVGSTDRFANAFLSELGFYSAIHDSTTQDRMALYEGRKHGFPV